MSTLGAEILEPSSISEAKLTHDRLVSTGWKLQALNSAADSMLRSASKLEEEMEKEAKYWDQILKVKEKGWAISRMPNESHTLGVRFGFLESSPEFRNKSMAALRRGDNGKINLDFAKGFQTNKVLQARVMYNNITVATSQVESDKMDDDFLETGILKARNNVFDAELFSELLRESRDLGMQGVRSSKSRISVPLHDNVILVIEMANRNTAYHPIDRSSQQFERVPQLVLTMLRILLCHSHAVHYRQRTAQPPVIGGKQRTRSSPALLRPILAYLNHRNNRQNFSSEMAKLSTILHNAAVSLETQNPKQKLDLRKLLARKSFRHPKDFAFSLLTSLTGNLETVLSYNVSVSSTLRSLLTAAPQQFDFAIHLRTRGLETEYRILLGSMALGSTRALYQETSFQDRTQFMKLVASSIASCLARAFAGCSNGRLQTTLGESSDLFIKLPDGETRKIELILDLDKLELLCAASDGMRSEGNMEVAKQWTADSSDSEGVDNLTTAVEQVMANALHNTPW